MEDLKIVLQALRDWKTLTRRGKLGVVCLIGLLFVLGVQISLIIGFFVYHLTK